MILKYKRGMLELFRFVFLWMVCFGLVLNQAKANVYEANISVDEIADNVSNAKNNAMRKAIRDGIKEVILKVSNTDGLELVDTLNDNQLQHFISSVQVWKEKSSDVRYIADVKIVVSEDVLKSYMQENNIPMIINEEKSILIIPLLEKVDGTNNLWGEDNFWRNVFLEKGKSIKTGNITVYNIDKNLGNITAVETNKIYEMSDDEFYELSSFNRVDNLYVVKYSLKDNKIYIKEFPSREIKEIDINGEDYKTDVNNVITQLRVLNRENVVARVETSVDEVFEVLFSYNSLSRWINLKKILKDNSFVKDINVKSMVDGKVYFSFSYQGIIEKLQTYLSLNGYTMKKEEGYYAIY